MITRAPKMTRGRAGRHVALAALATLAACGDSATPEPSMNVEVGCAAVTSWTYPETRVGQTSMTIFVAERDGGDTPAPMTMRLDGPDAARRVARSGR